MPDRFHGRVFCAYVLNGFFAINVLRLRLFYYGFVTNPPYYIPENGLCYLAYRSIIRVWKGEQGRLAPPQQNIHAKGAHINYDTNFRSWSSSSNTKGTRITRKQRKVSDRHSKCGLDVSFIRTLLCRIPSALTCWLWLKMSPRC